MKIGILPNFTREKTRDVFNNTISYLKKYNLDYYFDKTSFQSSSLDINKDKIIDNIFENTDLILVIGGDGSFIHAAKDAAFHKKPVLCVNAGNLAFLAGLEGNEVGLIEKLITGEYTSDRRMMLEVILKENGNEKLLGYCLNDIAVARFGDIKLIDLEVYCNNKKINCYRGDGVIVSTPTGSTAYSLSAGGPVIDPDLSCITLTPICSHSPLNRSFVFNEKSVITIKSPISSQKIGLSTDGDKSLELNDNFEIVIRQSCYYAEFIRIKSDEFFDVLNSKLS